MNDPHGLASVDWTALIERMPQCVRDDFASQRAGRIRRKTVEGYTIDQERTWLGHLATCLELAEYLASVHRVSR